MQENIVKLIDRETRRLLTEPPRTHLGASQLGSKCVRQTFYAFRWAYQVNALGRMRRLWNRGHEEEYRFTRWLRASGYEVRDYTQRLMYHDGSDSYHCIDWDANDEVPSVMSCWNECDDVSDDPMHIRRATARRQGPKQWGFTDHQGHFAGSSDGKIRGPHLPDMGWGGVEFKTHNDKSFKLLEKKGVLTSKPVHWVQMQVYMHYLELPWCLYLAVNKNDDHIYVEIVRYRREVAEQYIDLARNIIKSRQSPRRLTEDPSWFECKFCDFSGICHKGEAPERNCRSCRYAEAVDNKEWYCNKYQNIIPKNFIPDGCDNWIGIE